MVFEKGESSRAGEEAAAEQEASSGPVARQQQRAWVALSSIPVVVHRPGDERAAALAPGAADLLLELQDPPRASYLALPQRLVPDPRGLAPFYNYPYIITAAPGSLLFMATDLARGRNGVNSNYFLCDIRAATAKRLPAVPADLPIELSPRRTIGLVADPSSPGDYMITQLHPDATMRRHDALLCFSTATDQWFVKELADPPDHEPWGAHGVFPHDGFLWWVDVVYGMLFCNPFDDQPRLRLVPLPNGCAMPGLANRVYFSRLLDKRRCVRLSEGKLRYIQITGFSYNLATINDPPDNPTVSMWTLKALADQEDGDPWTAEYEVAFADIWNHHKYIDAGLPWGKVPNLALVDPNNHYVIYFFHERSLFAWDADAADLVSCEECLVDRDFLDLELQYSRFVEAWEWDPASSYGKHACTQLPIHA
jgi:hypothetical protein